jgi:hypothetical protein
MVGKDGGLLLFPFQSPMTTVIHISTAAIEGLLCFQLVGYLQKRQQYQRLIEVNGGVG